MANRTFKDAKSVKGTNPQYLIEKIIRSRIYDSKYWKEECFALSAELIVDKAMELRFIGGVYGGNIKPTPFLCLTLKMLQIQPEKDIVVEFLKNEDFKYVRALGAFYMRLVGTSLDCYKYLEPLFNDNRKLRQQNRQGQFELVHLDEFIDELLTEERVCDVILPRIQKRHILEENNEIGGKVSALDDDLEDEMETSGDDEKGIEPTLDAYSLIPMESPRKKRCERRRSPIQRGRSVERENNRDGDRKYREREREKGRSEKDRRHRVERDRRQGREKDSRRRSVSPPNRSSYREKDRDRNHEKKSRRVDNRGYDREHDSGFEIQNDKEYERDMKRKERERDRMRY